MPPADSVVISIYDRSESRCILQPGWGDVLYLQFHDTDGSLLGLSPFSAEQAQQALEFVHKHLGAHVLAIHCQMGRSRSAAMALFFSALLGVPCLDGNEPVAPKYNRHNQHVLRVLWDVLESDEGCALRDALGA